MSRHPYTSRRFVKGGKCEHDWIFTRPFCIRCTKCRITARREPSTKERRAFAAGGWHYLTPIR